MKIFEDLVKCKDCVNNINNKCILYSGKNVNEEDAGCYVGMDNILTDYKKVLKENEELMELKISASAEYQIHNLQEENKKLKEMLEEVKNNEIYDN